jgi:hypothetical protein
MTRTYAPAVAGSMTSVSFSSNTSLFSLTFQPAAAGPPPTLIYLHEALHYPLGVTIRLLPLACANVTHVPGSNLVKIVVCAPRQTHPLPLPTACPRLGFAPLHTRTPAPL